MHVSNMEFLYSKLFQGEAYKPSILCRRELALPHLPPPLRIYVNFMRFLSTRYTWIYNQILNLNFILLKTNELL